MLSAAEQEKAKRLLNTPLETLDKMLCEKNLAEFLKQMWPSIDPHPYVHGWHIDAICEHMQAVVNGDIQRILINIPPRHMKSIGIAVGLPAWAWIHKPTLQFLYSSYASSLSIRDGIKCRRVIDSPLYQARWGEKYSLTSDQNTKIRFDNNKGGYRLSTSVDGMTTGEGGDIVVIDDANNVKEAESDTMRNSTNQWFDEVMQTRLNNPQTGAIVVIQQRTHAKDLSGHILDKYGKDYYHLLLPAEYEKGVKCRGFGGWTDPRKAEGDLLWPERFRKQEIDKLKIALGVYAAAGQLQQRPSPRSGGMIPLNQFRRYKTPPAKEAILRLSLVFDTASKENELNDFSVCETWAETSWGYYLLNIWRKKVAFPELLRTAKSLCELECPHEVVIEDKASGIALIQCLRDPREGIKIPVIAVDPGAFSKVVRMENEATAIEAGLVYIPEVASWLPAFEDECTQFPMGEHDDQIDPMSMFLKRVRERKQRGPIIVSPDMEDMTSESSWRI
jgi:predicted phage terminase large subunit-like protein